MKKCLFVSIFIALSNFVYAQSSDMDHKQHELGVRFTGFDDFNVFFKKQKAQNKFVRHRFAIGSFSFNSNSDNKRAQLAYAFGFETRKAIRRDAQFMTGPELSFNFRLDSTTDSNSTVRRQTSIIPSFGWLLGIMIEPTDRLTIGLEVIPSLEFIYVNSTYADNSYSINVGLNSNATALSLMYKI